MLDKAFNSEFKEGRTQKYKLEDTNPDKFRVFVQWLYNQTLTYIYCEEDVKIYSEDHSTGCEKETISRIELWVLAEKLLIPQLQNKAMTLLRSVSRQRRSWCKVREGNYFSNRVVGIGRKAAHSPTSEQGHDTPTKHQRRSWCKVREGNYFSNRVVKAAHSPTSEQGHDTPTKRRQNITIDR